MSDLTIKDLAKTMRKMDIAMLATHHGDDIAVRPMSNNRDVDFDGDTYFFTNGDTTTVADIKSDARVGVSYQDDESDCYIALTGEASLHTDKDVLKHHWKESLAKWFENGLETDGLTLIKVDASRAHYWKGRKEGEVVID